MRKLIISILSIVVIACCSFTASSTPSNQIYGDGFGTSDLYKNENKYYTNNDSENNYNFNANSVSEIKNILINSIKYLSNSIVINYKGSTDNLKSEIDSLLEEIYASDGYTAAMMKRWKYSYTGYVNDVTLKFTFEYVETKEQLDEVNKKVDEILDKIINEDMNDLAIEKAIHDYIVKNVSYDETYINYSDYDALFSGKSVCQGYALLAYRMLTNSGIESKIIIGDANGPHAWNLVKLNDSWYHLDCTWDRGTSKPPDKISYDYFNKNDDYMIRNHHWDTKRYPESNRYLNEGEYLKGIWHPNYSSYKEVNDLKTVPVDKTFTIKFSKDIDASSINNNAIELIENNTGIKIPVSYTVSRSEIKVNPDKRLRLRHSYYLIINPGGIISTEKKQLSNGYWIKFNAS